MTNMTFTKGIGTPAFMAPEILHRKKYKHTADVYSFAITMYECLGWCEAFPKSQFKFPWKIAEFIMEGKRPPQNEFIPNELFDIIEVAWNQEPSQRPQISTIVKMIEKQRNDLLN